MSNKTIKNKQIKKESEEIVDDTDVEETGEDIEETNVVEDNIEKKKKDKIEYECDSIEQANKDLLQTRTEIKNLDKREELIIKALLKIVQKQSKQHKHKHTTGTQKTTGFNKEINVPEKFIAFYNKHEILHDTSFDITKNHKRADITKTIYKYIKLNNLYKKSPKGELLKREIEPDKDLIELLDIKKNEGIGFNNFQKYIARLYGKNIDEPEKITPETDADTEADEESSSSESEEEEDKKKNVKKDVKKDVKKTK